MADSRTVVNPFTRSESRMRRNTKGDKWVATKDEHRVAQRPGLIKPVTFEPHVPHHKGQAAAILEACGESETLSTQPEPTTLQAAIYDAADLKELPNTYVRLPSVRSWSSLRSSTYDDEEAVSPRTVTPYKQVSMQSKVSSFHSDFAPQRDSTVSMVEPIAFSSTEEARKGYNATVVPSFLSIIKRPKGGASQTKGTPSLANFTGILDSARKIYDVGPKGEGQKLWSTYKKVRKNKPYPTEVTQEEPLKQMPAPRRPSEGLSAHPPSRPAPSQDRLPLRIAMPPNGTRKESEVSRSSLEVPVRIEGHMERVTNRERPLPRVPVLEAAPKSKFAATKPLPAVPSRRVLKTTTKSLPAIPHIHSAPKRRRSNFNPSAPERGDIGPNPTYPTHRDPAQAPSTSKPTHNLKPSQWWKSLAEFTSETHPPPNPKATISRPRPFTALQNGLTANLAAEYGGVGGPGAASRLPNHNHNHNKTTTPPSHHNHSSNSSAQVLSARALGKQKSAPHNSPVIHVPTYWREKLHAERRKSSDDLSFACVGWKRRGRRA